MISVARKINVYLTILAILILSGVFAVNLGISRSAAGSLHYRVFVAGLGIIEGKWSGDTGIAVIGIETEKAVEPGQELKVIDLLVANKSSEKMQFNSDISLIDRSGRHFKLQAKGQPEVWLNPGALSQGTVIISVPKGLPDRDWTLEVKGGNLKEPVILPLRIIKVSEANQE